MNSKLYINITTEIKYLYPSKIIKGLQYNSMYNKVYSVYIKNIKNDKNEI